MDLLFIQVISSKKDKKTIRLIAQNKIFAIDCLDNKKTFSTFLPCYSYTEYLQ
ncbi:hypothetical protein SAMN06295967_105105 [Belliella buryatensis]|uniref:Uncharacterized protein n=1 Tax=Belliella buryatensis TaxID=1500549 RepID=A0A239CKX1_9BACT|nr:hypothetical protein SAMN06295967_105105 [Belliella buryatensis]